MTNEIKFEYIRTEEQWKRLEEFARSFGDEHKLTTRDFAMMAVVRDGKWVGYAQIVNVPIVFTSWHPDEKICSPRDVCEAMKAFVGWAKIQWNYGMTATPISLTSKFTAKVMEKLGFRKMNAELWETKN